METRDCVECLHRENSLANRVSELESRLASLEPSILYKELNLVPNNHRLKKARFTLNFISACVFPLVQALFRRVYNVAHRLKKGSLHG